MRVRVAPSTTCLDDAQLMLGLAGDLRQVRHAKHLAIRGQRA